MKIFLSNKKVQLIPHLYFENRFITDFKEMAKLFICFFSKQCSLLANHSKFSTSLSFWTDNRFSVEDIGKIIQGLDHKPIDLSFSMLKKCGDTICKSLEIIFNRALTSGLFPFVWKKSNMIPMHKKNDKENLINYRPVFLLPICGKIFERFLGFLRNTNLFHLTNPQTVQVVSIKNREIKHQMKWLNL